jgi:hypothetical protein
MISGDVEVLGSCSIGFPVFQRDKISRATLRNTAALLEVWVRVNARQVGLEPQERDAGDEDYVAATRRQLLHSFHRLELPEG